MLSFDGAAEGRQHHAMSDLVRIGSTQLSVEISPLGAEMRSLRTSRGIDLLWPGDPGSWAASAPLLFPVIGRMPAQGTLVGGRRFVMPMHGFAKDLRFEAVVAAPERATLRLVDDEATRAIYPFAFELLVAYAVRTATLTVTASLHNTGSEVIPASFGFHPGFRWPVAGLGRKTDYRLRFAEAEEGTVWRASSGFRLPDNVASPVRGRDLALRESEFATGAVIFGGLDSRAVDYCFGDRRLLTFGFDGCPNLALWSRPGGDFICIEPWNGLPQTAAFDGELADRPGMIALDPGRSVEMAIRVAVDDAMCL